MKPINKKLLEGIEIEVDEEGFTVWSTERINGLSRKHWLIDGSCLKETGEITFAGQMEQYKTGTIISGDKIILTQK